MDLKELGWEDVNGIRIAHDKEKCWAAVNTIMNLRVP